MSQRTRVVGSWLLVVVLGLGGSGLLAAQEMSPPVLTPAMLGAVDPADDEPSFLETLDFSGSFDIAYTFNFNASNAAAPGGENVARVFDRFHNEFTVHNAIIAIEREVTDEQWFGFAVMPTFGTDGQVSAGGGFDFGSGTKDTLGNTDLDVLQAYVSFYVPSSIPLLGETTIKLGKFFTVTGNETIPSGENTTFSRSLLFGLQPFTHTGILAEKTLIEREDAQEMIGMSLGFVNGWDSMRNPNDAPAGILSGRVSPMDMFTAQVNWVFGWIDRGNIGSYAAAINTRDFSNLIDIVGTFELKEMGLSVSANFDWYGDENSAAGGYADYYGFAGTVRYDFPNFFSESDDRVFYLAMRGEFLDNPDGFGPVAAALTDSTGTISASQVWELTWTLGYRPASFVLLRAEVRFDKANANIFENGTKDVQTTVAFNSVFSF